MIAHSIREQLYWQTRVRLTEGLPPETLEPVTDVVREDAVCDDWEPSVETLTEAEIEKILQHKERNARRMRRESARTTRSLRDRSSVSTPSRPFVTMVEDRRELRALGVFENRLITPSPRMRIERNRPSSGPCCPYNLSCAQTWSSGGSRELAL